MFTEDYFSFDYWKAIFSQNSKKACNTINTPDSINPTDSTNAYSKFQNQSNFFSNMPSDLVDTILSLVRWQDLGNLIKTNKYFLKNLPEKDRLWKVLVTRLLTSCPHLEENENHYQFFLRHKHYLTTNENLDSESILLLLYSMVEQNLDQAFGILAEKYYNIDFNETKDVLFKITFDRLKSTVNTKFNKIKDKFSNFQEDSKFLSTFINLAIQFYKQASPPDDEEITVKFSLSLAHIAIENKNPNVLQKLIDLKMNLETPAIITVYDSFCCNIGSKNGPNILQIAVICNSLKCLKILVKNKKIIESDNKYEESALYLAIESKNLECVKLLKENGSKISNKIYKLAKETGIEYIACLENTMSESERNFKNKQLTM